jgi:hypothetical protein
MQSSINNWATGWNNFIGGQGGGQGGGNPYAGILADYMKTMEANYGAQSRADAASRDAAIRRSIISYGAVPDFAKLGIGDKTLGFLKGAVNDKTRQLAQQNTAEGTSVSARMAHANQIANRRIPALNAGRGILHSGQTGADLGEQALNYKIQGFDTLNQMLGNIEGTVGNFLSAERARQEAMANARLQAAMAAIGTWGGGIANQGGGFAPSTGTVQSTSPGGVYYNPFAPTTSRNQRGKTVGWGNYAGGRI